jgi:hypothetical protein
MKLYKFRPTTRLDRVLDIVLNERLYCAPYKSLNDPFEGLFSSQIKLTPEERIKHGPLWFTTLPESMTLVHSLDDLIMEKASVWRISSLSADLSEIRLWSYYADAHRGVAVEIDFSGHEDEAREVFYEPSLRSFGYTLLSQPAVSDVLRCKTDHWRYEAEYRIIGESEFYSGKDRVTGIFCGAGMSPEMAYLIRKATPSTVPVFHTKLNERQLKVEKHSAVCSTVSFPPASLA